MIEELKGFIRYDPDLRYTANGVALCKFTVYDTEFGEFNSKERVVIWTELGEACAQQLVEGAKVLVKGKRKNRTWTGQDGQEHSSEEVTAYKVWELDDTPTEMTTAKEIVGEDAPF